MTPCWVVADGIAIGSRAKPWDVVECEIVMADGLTRYWVSPRDAPIGVAGVKERYSVGRTMVFEAEGDAWRRLMHIVQARIAAETKLLCRLSDRYARRVGQRLVAQRRKKG